jgi:hypothetical protein
MKSRKMCRSNCYSCARFLTTSHHENQRRWSIHSVISVTLCVESENRSTKGTGKISAPLLSNFILYYYSFLVAYQTRTVWVDTTFLYFFIGETELNLVANNSVHLSHHACTSTHYCGSCSIEDCALPRIPQIQGSTNYFMCFPNLDTSITDHWNREPSPHSPKT